MRTCDECGFTDEGITHHDCFEHLLKKYIRFKPSLKVQMLRLYLAQVRRLGLAADDMAHGYR